MKVTLIKKHKLHFRELPKGAILSVSKEKAKELEELGVIESKKNKTKVTKLAKDESKSNK